MRLRAMATSPASLTSRSMTSARTRRSAFGWSSRSAGGTAFVAGAGTAAARAALERMQHPLQRLAERGVVRVFAPVAQRSAHRRNQLMGLVEENLQQLGVEVVVEPSLPPLGRGLLDLEFLRRKLWKLQLGN